MNDRTCRFQSRFISTDNRMLGRSKPATKVSAVPAKSLSPISFRVTSSAVAVNAANGTAGKSSRKRASSAYSGRKDGPHCAMQWASSITMSPTGIRRRASSIRSVMSRSGAM